MAHTPEKILALLPLLDEQIADELETLGVLPLNLWVAFRGWGPGQLPG